MSILRIQKSRKIINYLHLYFNRFLFFPHISAHITKADLIRLRKLSPDWLSGILNAGYIFIFCCHLVCGLGANSVCCAAHVLILNVILSAGTDIKYTMLFGVRLMCRFNLRRSCCGGALHFAHISKKFLLLNLYFHKTISFAAHAAAEHLLLSIATKVGKNAFAACPTPP